MRCSCVVIGMLFGAKCCMCERELNCRYAADVERQHDAHWRKLTARYVDHLHACLVRRINANYIPLQAALIALGSLSFDL